jgi:transcriptional regulator with GAF, ATPase, and Fis domain
MENTRTSDARTPAEPAEEEHWYALLEVLEAIGSHRTLPELIHEVAKRLGDVVGCESVLLMLHDPGREVLRLHLLGGWPTGLTGNEGEHDLRGSLLAEVLATQKTLFVPSTRAESDDCRTMDLLAANGLNSVW